MYLIFKWGLAWNHSYLHKKVEFFPQMIGENGRLQF